MASARLGLREVQKKVLHENYKLIYRGNDDGRHGVGVLLAPEMAPCVEKIDSVSERNLSISYKTKIIAFTLIQVYAPQRGRPSFAKDQFYQDLQDVTDTARYKGKLIACGDYGGYISCVRDHAEAVVGTFSVGDRN